MIPMLWLMLFGGGTRNGEDKKLRSMLWLHAALPPCFGAHADAFGAQTTASDVDFGCTVN
jgi:hypothetical protein